jgi:hypothetical protein
MQSPQGNGVPAARRSQAQRIAVPHHVPASSLAYLSDLLDPREFATVLITGEDRRSALTVVRRQTPMTEDIYADAESYWWERDAERIAPVTDPAAAARAICSRLGTATEPVRGIDPVAPPTDLQARLPLIPKQR